MKYCFLFFCAFLASPFTYSQNIFLSTGPVGIGTHLILIRDHITIYIKARKASEASKASCTNTGTSGGNTTEAINAE
ncbi:hypothetical protein SAMN05660461_5862 [Chitinophaga ginsengisegetis]|uniref:Secreted protein n=1 Tax=Chitinophaga ginsengisegetis TaxID=393003 RepID=A0A1T5PBD0_9BACT|nr:hypothetical protein [Chitinophaga ginsengisegetis]SKD09962.1 hypothetical protein SAMN05660461_5862 [Chitinophaga ginsengisegetis]